MVTSKLIVDSAGSGREEALSAADRFSVKEGLDHRSALHVHLLTEEAVGMVTAITEEFSALFWLESRDEDKVFIHLLAETDMDMDKKQALIDTSRNKRNSAAKGVMGKIREIVENGIYKIDEVGKLEAQYGGVPLMYSMMGAVDSSYAQTVNYQWTLGKYRQNVEEAKQDNPAALEAWDELEKSIIANMADDVKVSVKGSSVELVIEKDVIRQNASKG